ncbi:hypothetical protein GCM10027161_58000 [Microbispora hainanensis]
MSDFTPTPYILTTSVLTDVARGDADLIGLLQDFDRAGQTLVVPALAAAGALLDGRGTPEAQTLLARRPGRVRACRRRPAGRHRTIRQARRHDGRHRPRHP